MKRRRSAKRR